MFLNAFRCATATWLAVTALFKIISAFGSQGILLHVDPLLGLQMRWVLLIVAAFELTAVGLCIRFGDHLVTYSSFCWLAFNFLAYRVGLFVSNVSAPCPCLGTFGDSLGIPPALVSALFGASALSIFCISAGILSVRLLSRHFDHVQS